MDAMDDEGVRTVSILIFDEVEVLDFTGPFEVFSLAGRPEETTHFRVELISPKRKVVSARGGLRVEADRAFSEDGSGIPTTLLVIPGGFGVRVLLGDPVVRRWVLESASSAEVTLSVCTGALLLADAGLLRGRRATTHHGSIQALRELAPDAVVEEGVPWVDNGNIVTAGGIAAGIAASLHLVSRFCGEETARRTADYMEYPGWPPVRSPVPS